MSSEIGQSAKSPWVIAGWILAGVTVIGLGMFIGQVVRYMRSIGSGEPNPFQKDQRELIVERLLSQASLAPDVLLRVDPRGSQHPTKGNPQAPIRMVEFLDYECPFCRETSGPIREFMRRHADDVFLIIRDFPLEDIHPGALQASLAARCVFRQGNVERFWNFHDHLFRDEDGLTKTDLRNVAVDVGVDIQEFDDCLERRSTEAEVRASQADGLAAGVRGTPTFFVNGKKIQGNLTLETLEAIYQSLKKKPL